MSNQTEEKDIHHGRPARHTHKEVKPPPAPPTEKWCPGCQVTLPISDFGKKASSKDGYQDYCRPCWNERCRAYGCNYTERTRMLRDRHPVTIKTGEEQ